VGGGGSGPNASRGTAFRNKDEDFWRKAVSQGADFLRSGKCNVKPTSLKHCSRLQQYRSHAVIEDWMIPPRLSRDPQCFLLGQAAPQNCPFTCGISTPSYTRSLEPTSASQLNDIPVGSDVFAYRTIDTHRQTDTHTTLRTTSLAIDRIYAMLAMRPKNLLAEKVRSESFSP